MRETADISVLIVAYKSRDTIGRCLNALAAQTVPPREILLLENGSPAGEAIEEADIPDGVRFIKSEDNLGFAAGNNRLAEMAGGRWLAFLNPDAFPHPGWIAGLDQATQRYPDIRLFGSTQLAADKPGIVDGAGDVYHAAGLAYRAAYLRPDRFLPEEGEVFGPCGAAALISSELFAELNGFDEDFFCYNEDVDLAYRARLLGERAVQLRTAIVDHLGYGSSGRRSDFATYYGVRNRLWVFLKNTPGWLLWLLAPFHAFATLALGIAASLKGQGGVFWRAIGDGLKAWPAVMRSRRAVQKARRVKPSQIANAMCWDSRMLLTRLPDVRPYEGVKRNSAEAPER
ncbi:glycosyltransferase family 2 protein [Maricaulis sp.]|uniref:glycosyltransferase family 2 protein n=1 Tax=Maricaulis sp. TaxID=1486257 RepID=UPI00261B94AE|nr:glycosyltransferase family 2 protein [Maricaulis sp.]